MTLSPPRHDTSFVRPEASELLIREARSKGRRRRLTKGVMVLAVVALMAVIAFIALRGPANRSPLVNKESGRSTSSRYTQTHVANLAGSDTFAVSGSRVWVVMDQESPTKNVFALTELNGKKGSLVRVIPNKVGGVVESGKNQRAGDLTEPGPMTVSGSHLWVSDDQYWRVTELNASNGSLVRVIDAKADGFAIPGAIAVSGGHVWVINQEDGANTVTELNASNGSLVRVLRQKDYGFVQPDSIVASGDRVFVLNSDGDSITEINANSGSLIREFNARAGCCAASQSTFEWAEPMSLAVSGSHLWIGDEHVYANGGTEVSTLVELNTNDGAVIRVIKGRAYALSIPEAIAVSDGQVWVENGYNSVTELNANTGALERVISTKLDPKGFNSSDGMAVVGRSVYILNIYSGQRGSVTVINARTGKIVRVIG
jgi:outer membrane protein assembly factor BamB